MLIFLLLIFFGNNLFSQNNKLTAKNPKDKAVDYLMNENYFNALFEINKSIKLDSNNADSFYLRGFIYQEMKDLNKALIDYNTSLKLNPKQTDALLKMGTVYLLLKNKVKACEAFILASSYVENNRCEIKNKLCNK